MRSRYGMALACPVLLFAYSSARAAPPLDAYGDLPGVEDVAISPNGHALASIIQVAGQRSVMVIDNTGKLLASGATGEAKVRGIGWAGDQTVLITKTSTVSLGPEFAAYKYELAGTIIVPLDGRKSEQVFGRTEAIAKTTRGRYGIRQIDGRAVGYFGGIAMDVTKSGVYFRHGRATLYAVDLATNSPRQVARPPAEDHYRDWVIDAAGNVAVTLDISASSGLWTMQNAAGTELARGIDPTGEVSLLCLGKDGSSVIYSIQDETGDSRWLEVPLAGGTPADFLPGKAVDRLYIDERNSQLLGYRLGGESAETIMFDPYRQSAVTRIFRAFQKREVKLMDWTPDFSKIIVRTSGNGDSGTWFLVDVAARKADPIGDERPGIPSDQVGPISKVVFKAADGLEMDGILTVPPGREAKGLPVVILPHGGPSMYDSLVFNWWAQAFASRGYAVFQPNFRGSTNRSDAFKRAGYGEWGRKMQSDLSDGLAELARLGIVDPRRACIVGASYGGYAALAGVTLQHGIYRCAVSVAGVSDVELMYNTDVAESGNSRMTWKSLRKELGDPKGYDAISPRRFAASADAPVMLIHGKDDTVVPFRQSQVMASALKSAGKPYELIALPGEDHYLSRGETRKRMLTAAVAFVEKNNPAD